MKPSHRLVIIAASVTLMVVSAAGPAAADWSAGLELYSQGRFADSSLWNGTTRLSKISERPLSSGPTTLPTSQP